MLCLALRRSRWLAAHPGPTKTRCTSSQEPKNSKVEVFCRFLAARLGLLQRGAQWQNRSEGTAHDVRQRHRFGAIAPPKDPEDLPDPTWEVHLFSVQS